jgi:hypothetical protein
MPIYVPGKVTLRQTYIGTDDPDAAAYIAAVEAADGEALETGVQVAIHSFVKGCKADGIWPAIKASCILAGARTRTGSLIPLVGPTPTSFAFVDNDYDRETGWLGDGSTKYIATGRTAQQNPQDNAHFSVFVSNAGTTGNIISTSSGGVDNNIGIISGEYAFAIQDVGTAYRGSVSITGFLGANRSSSAFGSFRRGGVTINNTRVSGVSQLGEFALFRRSADVAANWNDGRIAFYSIGEALDLARLDARVTDLINAIGAAIP